MRSWSSTTPARRSTSSSTKPAKPIWRRRDDDAARAERTAARFRFRIDSIASEKRIASLVVADLNSDGRADIAYYGEPKELVVQYNQGTNGWSSTKRFPIDDGQLTQNGLSTGSLDGSGRTGLMLLGENHLYWLAQNADHTLAEPEKIPFSGTVKAADPGHQW
jgi:hypothetical protein